jgi:hypothetical protein
MSSDTVRGKVIVEGGGEHGILRTIILEKRFEHRAPEEPEEIQRKP